MHRHSAFLRSGAIALTLAVSAVACGSDDADSSGEDAVAGTAGDTTEPVEAPTPAAPNGDVVVVEAIDNSFRPETIEVTAGTEVRWENDGRNDHNVLPSDETQDWGVDVEAFKTGDEYTRLFDLPGTYAYYCSIHGTKDVGMIGAVVVLPADS